MPIWSQISTAVGEWHSRKVEFTEEPETNEKVMASKVKRKAKQKKPVVMGKNGDTQRRAPSPPIRPTRPKGTPAKRERPRESFSVL